MRNIHPEIWADDWFSELEPLGKLIWIGVISKVADDQGRFRNNAELVKSQLFPMTSTPGATEISLWLSSYATDGRLIAYDANGKSLFQVRNWWKYQNSSQWMARSTYPAPANWRDWWNINGKGRIPDTAPYPKETAGIYIPIYTPIDTPVYIPTDTQVKIEYVNDKEKVNDNDKDKEKGKGNGNPEQKPQTQAAAALQFGQNIGYQKAVRLLEGAARMPALPADGQKYLETVQSMLESYGEEKTRAALEAARVRWTSTPRKNGYGNYSVINFGWVDWAMEEITKTRRNDENNSNGNTKLPGASAVTESDRAIAAQIRAARGLPALPGD